MSRKQEIRERRRRQKQRQRMIVIALIVGGALLIAAALIFLNSNRQPVVAITPQPRPMADANAMGDPDAPITITEYSDFQCPYCARFWRETEDLLVEHYVKTGKVYFVYRSMGNFLGDNIARHTGVANYESRDAAEAAYCAGDQNMFWEYHDILFSNQTGEGVGDFTASRLMSYAEALGLDMDQFRECFRSHKYRSRVEQDQQDGLAAGVKGTPAFVITYEVNGETRTKMIAGAYPFSTFQQEIEAALAEIAGGQ
ncbi:MAG: DsbA family protein [Anaerolineae bacterium]|nr:MAG: DsbA family protein [Anaerolineae bacterium]